MGPRPALAMVVSRQATAGIPMTPCTFLPAPVRAGITKLLRPRRLPGSGALPRELFSKDNAALREFAPPPPSIEPPFTARETFQVD